MEKELNEILADDPGCKYELQYVDYDKNTWTAPLLLTEASIKRFANDPSLRCCRVTFTKGVTLTLY